MNPEATRESALTTLSTLSTNLVILAVSFTEVPTAESWVGGVRLTWHIVYREPRFKLVTEVSPGRIRIEPEEPVWIIESLLS